MRRKQNLDFGKEKTRKDCKILVRNKISIVVEKKSLTKLFKTRHNGRVEQHQCLTN